MEGPGMSLFQGAETLHIKTNDSELEQEELEDQKRRNEELRNELENAFDDLIDDEDCTADTSVHFRSGLTNGHGSKSPEPEEENGNIFAGHFLDHPAFDHPAFNSLKAEIDKLHKVIESKDREIENVSQVVLDERKKNEDLKKRLSLSEAEKERAHMTRKQTHELLVESKGKISELQDCTDKLKTKIKSLEDHNNELVAELEKTRVHLSDAQHKYYMVEKNVGLPTDRSNDYNIKQLKERHSAQVEMMQQQIDSLRNKLEEKESGYKTLETRYTELQKSREALLIEKTETINQLAKNLEESQKHCQQLIAKEDCSQENIRLQRVINAFENQAEEMRKTINELQTKLTDTTNELKLMESLLSENVDEISENFRRLDLEKETVVGSTPINSKERFSRLKHELYRSVAGQKTKRDEIRRLQEQLNSRNDEIKKVKEDENKALVQMNVYRENNVRLENHIKVLEAEIQKIKESKVANDGEHLMSNENDYQLSNLEKKYNLLEQELKNARKEYEIEKGRAEILNMEVEKLRQKVKFTSKEENVLEKVNSKMKNLNVDFEELIQEHESLKNKYNALVKEHTNLDENFNSIKLELQKQKFLLTDAQNECDRVKNLYAEISNAKDALSKQLIEIKAKDLNKELYVQKEKCAILERSLQLAEMKCAEMEKSIQVHKQSFEKELEAQRQRFDKEKEEILKSAAAKTPEQCVKCIDHIAEVTKFEIQNLKLQDQCTTHVKEVNDLKLALSEAKHTILDLNEKVSLREQRDNMIEELKDKARQFEEYIRQQSSKENSESTSPKRVASRDQSVETSPELELNYAKRRIESKLRDEMAKIFAIEIKSIEENFKTEVQELEKKSSSLKSELQRTKYELQLRQNEVEVLKHAILAEREKMQEILRQKDSEQNHIRDKLTTLLEKCRNELKTKQLQLQKTLTELDERTTQIEAERTSMKIVSKQWEEERKALNERLDELRAQMEERRQEHEKLVEHLQSKYLSAKKTAANYKRYSEDKEKHMLQEYDRIKSGYENSIEKIERKMKDIIQKQNKEMKEKINEYEAKLANLHKVSEKRDL